MIGLGLSITQRAVLQMLGFSPASLFAASEQGVWYDPSDFSTMFQDAAGTTPVTAVGQPVGRILDKSGRGNHATQTTATSRPILQQDGSGRYYLLFDGVDDSLVTPSIDFTSTDKMTVFTADYSVWDDSLRAIVGLSSSVFGLNGTFWLTSYDGVFNAYSVAYLRGDLRGASSYGEDQRSMGVRHLVRSVRMDISKSALSDEILIRVNGESKALNGAALDPSAGSGNFGNHPLYVGRVGSSFPFKGRIYSLIVRGAQSTAQQIASAEAWVNSKTGAY